MLNRFNPFRKKEGGIYNHRIEVTYILGSIRTQYEGTDSAQAEKVYDKFEAKYRTYKSNIHYVEWYRDGEKYKHI